MIEILLDEHSIVIYKSNTLTDSHYDELISLLNFLVWKNQIIYHRSIVDNLIEVQAKPKHLYRLLRNLVDITEYKIIDI